MRNRDVFIIVLGVGAVLLLAGSASAASSAKVTSSHGASATKGARFNTGPGSVKDWAKTRFQAAYKYLLSQGFTNANPEANASQMALSALAHWANETGSGKNEYGYNLGGRHARPSDAKYWTNTGAGDKADFPIFDSLDAAVKDYFELVSKGYTKAWELLKAHPTESDWYEQLGRSGYYGGDPASAGRTWATLRANLEQYATEQ